jgi:septum formation protein
MLVLASASPRRQDLLRAAGFDFVVDAADVDESRLPAETPRQYVERLACAKARSVSQRHPDALVLGADTAVVLGDEVLGKPDSPEAAAAMLGRLSGRAHEVLTGVAVIGRGQVRSRVEQTTVWIQRLSPQDVAAYVASGEPLDKAGAYAIQGLASRFVSRIDGSYSNVVGLPLVAVAQLLRAEMAPGGGQTLV